MNLPYARSEYEKLVSSIAVERQTSPELAVQACVRYQQNVLGALLQGPRRTAAELELDLLCNKRLMMGILEAADTQEKELLQSHLRLHILNIWVYTQTALLMSQETQP